MRKPKWLTGDFAKYTVSSIVSAIFEILLWALLAWLLSEVTSGFLVDVVPMAAAKILSYLELFFANQKLVFKSSGRTGKALLRFCLQAAPLAVLQIVLSAGGYKLFQLGEEQVILRGIVYMASMMITFVLSFLAQKLWVFPNQKTEEVMGSDA